jgi:peptide methionine sulfoxide reductase MsrA
MKHFLSGIDLSSDTPNDFNEIIFGAGCFWGVERKFWSLEGVWLTSVGYAGGNSKILHMNKFVMKKQIMLKL